MHRRLVEQVHESIFRVVGIDRATAGTAFSVGPNAILTCTHVLDAAAADADGKYELVHYKSNRTVKCMVVAESCKPATQEDIALLSTEEPLQQFLTIAQHFPEVGDGIYSFGFPAAKLADGLPA